VSRCGPSPSRFRREVGAIPAHLRHGPRPVLAVCRSPGRPDSPGRGSCRDRDLRERPRRPATRGPGGERRRDTRARAPPAGAPAADRRRPVAAGLDGSRCAGPGPAVRPGVGVGGRRCRPRSARRRPARTRPGPPGARPRAPASSRPSPRRRAAAGGGRQPRNRTDAHRADRGTGLRGGPRHRDRGPPGGAARRRGRRGRQRGGPRRRLSPHREAAPGRGRRCPAGRVRAGTPGGRWGCRASASAVA
jgi:hypothetical protein